MSKFIVLCCYIYHICLHLSYQVDFDYHDDKELTEFIQNFGQKFLNVQSNVYSIGKSVNNRDLWVLEITGKNNKTDLQAIPNIKFIGNIHGNEAIGRELLLHFAEYLSANYLVDNDVTHLLNNTRLHIMPSMNPDGFADASEGSCDGDPGRTNACGVDLNRNFPDQYLETRTRQGVSIQTAYEPEACQRAEQLETTAVRSWMEKIPFILSASLHGGALVANYPFDSSISFLPTKTPVISPDDDVFRYLATTYARTHTKMSFGITCGSNVNFTGGITNGAAWYPLKGGMQDYNYVFHGCMELTLELSCCKYPMSRKIRSFWIDNNMALLKYALLSLEGVKGIVQDKENNQIISNATLRILGRSIEFRTTLQGEFWRILLPGNYTLRITHELYHVVEIDFSVSNYTKFPFPTILTIYMRNISYPLDSITEPSPISQQTVYSTTTTKNTPMNITNRFGTDDFSGVPSKLENSDSEFDSNEISLLITSGSDSIYYNIYNGLIVFIRLIYELS